MRSYLLHYGYQATLNSFELECKSTVPPILMSQENGLDSQDILYALNQRRELRQVQNRLILVTSTLGRLCSLSYSVDSICRPT